MSDVAWVVCERTGRWTASLRTALVRRGANPTRVYEVRSLTELTALLKERPSSLAMMEVHPANLAETLAWLSEARILHPQARFVGLVDLAAAKREANTLIACALRSAGTFHVMDSPRQVHFVIDIGQRHAEAAQKRVVLPKPQQSLTEWAWELLPWQPVKRPVA